MADQVQEPIQNHKAPADHLLKNVDLGPPQQPQKKTDGNTAFLRAARSGNLEKVLEFINANVDINTSNSNGLNALHLASKDGHVEVAAELLKRGANVDAATKKGNTALHIASLAGQEEVVKLLIEHGASVNLQSQSGFTPLYMAAQENHERVVRYLLNNGANQSLATEDGFTPLAVAMQQGHDKVVTELLENDTRGKIKLPALHIAAKKDDCKAAALLLQSEHNPDITSKSGFTPLHIASHYGNDAIASLLLAKGADVNYAAKHNITPLHVAAKWGRNNMVILLLDKGASIIAKTRDGLTPLHCAARSGHEQVVDTLLQRHAPITAKTKNGLAPLHMASQGDHVEAARVLLSHRAPVDDVTVDYLTALHVASHCGHVSVAKLLLDRKADPNARALNGFTPLHIACKKNRVKIVELLLKHGGSIEATTESGLSPLHVASFMGCMNIVIYLLQCGANPDVSTIRGETPLHLASRANQTDIIRILLRNGAQVDAKAREQQTPLHIAARLGNTDIVMLLLQHGANVDSVTKDLYTSLHIAAKEDQEEVAQALLENNASMTATTKKGFTPLHLAAKYGRSSIATLLLQRGAPVDAQGKNGVTPLHVASHYDHQGIALLLLDKGASPHATAKNGHTPLHIAAKKNQMDIAAMLLEYGANAGAESKAGFTPLHLSAQEGHVDMTNLLLEHKADVNHSSKNGLTPLHLCAQEDCVDVATILVKNGADVNTVTKAGYSPLHIASHFGQLNMVRFLLSNKAKVDTATSTGYTPLHQAAQQGNSAIVAVLLDNGASPDTKNNQGQTALCIAQKLGYISVVEVLKNVTDNTKAPTVAAAPTGDEKYKVVAPETMQENFMSDSEDEGGEDATNEQSYRYLTIDEMKSLGDDSLPIDTSKEDRYDTTAGHDESISPQHTYNQLSAAPVIDNVDVTRAPVIQTGKLKWKSFLVSFLVDAKGGAMRGCRHSGVRVIVPSQCVTMPTRVTCRYVRRDKPNHPPPPPLMEGEALASRILELGPVGVKFLGPVVIEVPNFAALRGNEREIVILRSDNGETWREHTVDSSSEAVHDILSRSFDKDGNQIQSDEPNRITSIVTHDFPHYFAIVSRIRQEVHAIGPEGGMVSSSVVPQVQAVFPQGALTKKIKVGLQAQPIPSELTAAVLGNCVAVSPIVTIEPRRRKFHKPITLTLPVPQAANKGMINQYSGDAPTLRLLCSITGGTSRAQWEDVTGSTPLTFVKECVSFTTTVSARFWLMDIRDIAVATKKATELYRETIHIPFMAKFVVFAKRIDNNEARLRVFCMTDDKEDKTLESQEHFTEVAKSRDVEVLEGKKQLIELSGNLISVTKSGDQLKLGFNAFQENRLPFTIRIKDSLADPIGRMLFFKEQKPVKTSTPHPPICVLNIVLPDTIIPDSELADSPIRKYNLLNDTQGYHRSELKFSDISNLIGEDWEALAEKLGIRSSECKVIKIENPEGTARQSSVMLKQWNQRAGTKATANILESALLSIGREDIVQECFLNTNQKNKLPSENGLITHKADDIRGSKKDPYSTDDDEKKYTAEEKIIDETELKSVSERKQEIEKRLLDEQNVKKENLKERSDSEEKRQQSSKQSSEDREIIKNVVHDEKETFEPTKMTFQQKRLSFEKGYSVDKILSEGIAASDAGQSVVEEQDKTVSREKSVEKVLPATKIPQKQPTPEKPVEDVCQKPLKKDKSVEDKVSIQKNKSDDKIAQKTDQKEKTPEDKKPVQKGKSVEKSASKDKVDKVSEKSPPKDKVDKPLEKSASKDKVDKTLEKSASKDKVDKTLEKSASKDKVDKTLEKSASKDKVDKSLEKSASKDKVDKTLEKSASKDKVDKSLEKSASKDKVDKSLDKSASKDKVDKPLEKSASKDKVDKHLEKSSSKDKVDKLLEKSASKDKVNKPLEKSASKDKVDKPLEKSASTDKVEKSLEKSTSKDKVDKSIEKATSKDKVDEKVPSVVEKPAVEEKIKSAQKAKSPEKQSSKDGSLPKDTKDDKNSQTFQEKRLSFEQGDGAPSTTTISQTTVVTTKIPNDETKDPETISKVTTTTTTTTVEKRSDTDARRDSELFEGVSLGLGKLEAKPIPPEQNFLSPKPLMTPPPSPAEFSKDGSEEWHKTDSLDSNRSNKSATDIETPSETQTVTPTEYIEHIASHIVSNDHQRNLLNNLSEDSIEQLPVPDYNFESIAAESVSELEAPISSRVQIVSETSPPEVFVSKSQQPQQQQQSPPQKYTDEMIDKLIERERAKLIASGIKFDSDTDEEEIENESSKRNGRSSRVDLSSDEDNNKETNSDSDAEVINYLKATDNDDHVASDHSERSPQRKVAFRLNSDENELVYPGQTDSEENTSISDNSDDSVANDDNAVVAGPVATVAQETKILNTPPNEVERKFERMASETEDDVGKVEGEFHRIVSQLSFEEVTDCLNAWNETESAAKRDSGDKPNTVPDTGRLEGNKQLSTESDTTRSFSQDLENDTVESMDYVSRKKFWQSFESASVDKSSSTATGSAPVPKPRASICTTGVTNEEAPVAAKRSTENIRSGFVTSKSESMQERFSSDIERFSKPSMKKVHSLTSYSTDSEAEYIATCGIEKLAYENIAFSEEDESICEAKPAPEVEGGVKAKKMFFEKMQSDSSQESVTSPPLKKDEIAGIVKTSIVTTEKPIKKDSSQDSVSSQTSKKDEHAGLVKSSTASIIQRIEQPLKRDSSQESVTSPLSRKDEISEVKTEKQMKKDSSLDSVSSTSSKKDERIGLVKSTTASIEKRIEQPVNRDSSQESVTSPLSGKDGIAGVTTENQIKKDSSLESVSSTSSKKDERIGLVKSTTASIEKRIEQPVKRDSSLESVTSPLSRKDGIAGVTTENQIKKDSSLESVSSTSSKKDDHVSLVKSAAASIEKRIEHPVKKDSSQESISSSKSEKEQSTTGLVKNAAKTIESSSIEKIDHPVKKESTQESLSSVSVKKDSPVGLVKSATSSIEKIIKHESSIESVGSLPSKKDETMHTTKTTTVSNEKSFEQPLNKDSSLDGVSSMSSKKDEPVVITSEKGQIKELTSQKETPDLTPSVQSESSVTINKKQEVVAATIEKEPVVTVTKKDNVEITISKKVEPVVTTTVQETGVTTKLKEISVTTCTESKKDEPAVTTQTKKTVVTTSVECKENEPVVTSKVKETVTTTSADGKLVTATILKEEKSIETHQVSSNIDETTKKVVSVPKVARQFPKENTTLNKVPSKDEIIEQVKTTTGTTSTKGVKHPPVKDSTKGSITSEQLADSSPAVTKTTTTVTNTEIHTKPSKDSSIESITSISSKQSDVSAVIKASESISEQSITSISSKQSDISAVIKASESISEQSITSISSKQSDVSAVFKASESISEQSISKDPSLDSVTSLSLKTDELVGAVSEISQCKDSSCDSSSLSSKKDRSIEAADSMKLDTKSPSAVESKPNGSLDESIDSTQSESDITPEDLRDKQFIMQDWESTSELLENLVQDRTIPMAQSSSIIVQEIPQQQIQFSDSEQYKHFNNIRTVSEDDSECEVLKEEAKAAAENLINEIEEELGRRPDIVECLLKNKIDELVEEIASSSNDITDEDLKSTGTEIDLPMPYGFDDAALMKMKISQASPTEYEIKFEQVEEFNVLESVDFEEPIIPEDTEISLRSGSESFMNIGNKEVIKPSRIPIRNSVKSSVETKSPIVQRKTSDEDKSRTSTSPEYVQDFIEIRHTKYRKSGADFEPCSSSSESHYHSFEQSGTTSRPLSSDVEGLLSGGGVPGTTGSSEYETAASHDTSHDFHTAMSSVSLQESIKSIDSESSGNLGSAEVSSEISETLVASSAELDHDIDLPPSHYYDDNNTRRSAYRSSPIEPYDHDIPMEVIKGVSQSFDMSHLEPFANSQKKVIEVAQPRPQSTKFKEDSHDIDDKLLSSSEDVSMFSLTDGGTNLQTVIEVNSTAESDKMDNSIISEQSLTISATSNQFSTSSSAELKDEIEDKKPGDSNSVQSTQDLVTKSGSNASVTCAQISSGKIDKSDSKDTICRDISIDDIPNITIQHSTPPQHPLVIDSVQESPSKDPSISPDSESFELIEQPDMMEDFVIIEEVAKEACEQDPEGKSIKITGKRQIAMSYDDEIVIPPKTSSTLTRVEYYGGADGCGFPIEGVPEVAGKPVGDENEIYEHEVEEGKKWIEMQFQADSEDASGYEYGYERGPLEDIKEEDTDDMQSSKMGSVGSQISQSIGSLGSMKQSLSSTPDYDILAGKRYFANKSSDKDDVSQGSLQEFERLEQLMTLESVKNKLSGSQDSLGSNNSTNGGGNKKRSTAGDDVSVSSLNEFEGLEHACLEAEKVKERARIEENLLSQIEEGHESQASESESCETLEKSCYDESDNDEDYDQKMFEIDEIIRQAQSNVEKFVDVDQLERTESLGRGDSFEETARIPDFELDQPLTENTHSSSDIYSGKKYIEHVDLSHSLTTSTDSLEPKGKPGDILVTSTDSLEGGPTTATTSKSKSTVISDSLDATDNRVESPRSAYDVDEDLQIGVGDDLDARGLSPHHLMLSSPDSLDATSSAGTHATYHNETDSAMSSSFTSAGSNTMISSTENLENIVTNYSNWLDSNPYMTEVAYNVSDKSYVTTERVAESSHQQRTTSSQGQDAKKMYEKDMAAFQPGEYYTESREVDSEGNVHIKKVVESRAVVTSEKIQSSEKIILDPEQYRGRITDTDFATVSSSSSHFVTTTTSTTTESSSGIKTESSARIEKKEVSGEASSDKPKS